MKAEELLDFCVRDIPDDPVYAARLAEELRLIDLKGFVPVFLQVIEILAPSKDLPHIVRGSAGCSLLCYLLGITNFDPIAQKIPLSRFMHELREDQPDVDIDFPHNMRDEVVERVRRRFPGRVARISNHIAYRESSAVREVIRRHGHRKFVPRHYDLLDIFSPQESDSILQEAANLVGTHRTDSLHCGGVVIFDQEVPPELISKPGQIRLDKDEVEDANYIKIDLLCNRGLTIAHELDRTPLDQYPDGDEATADLLSRADTLGVIYGESPTMQMALRAIQPRCRADVAIALALIRPAAASRGRKASFLENWKQRREQTQIVFDDDAIMLIQRLLGCSEGQADLYRRGFTKGNAQIIAEVGDRLAGNPERQTILDDLAQMKSYSFCKSHAISYSYLVWALAYQKAHNPSRFWTPVLNHAQSMYRYWVHVQEAKRAGYKFEWGKPPWTLAGDTLVNPGRQKIMFQDGWEQYADRGYWTSNRFMPGMYCRQQGNMIWFRGLIACDRVHEWDETMTFATVGTGKRYLNLSFRGRLELDRYDVIEGEGEILNRYGSDSIQVNDYSLEQIK